MPTVLPEWSSAKRVPPYTFLWYNGMCALILLILVFLMPGLMFKFLLFCATLIIFLMASLRLLTIVMMCVSAKPRPAIFLETDPRMGTRPWPRFTILVPLFKEKHMVKVLMNNLAQLEYTTHKLEIVMVCEADDPQTCEAVRKHLRAPFTLFEVPPSHPRTKPKALNAALAAIPDAQKGDIISIYDAEDRPHRLQLKAAAQALCTDPLLAAVQSPLGYYNHRKNMLTVFFALEYASLFHIWNPALARLRLPFTLGGTSNHIRRHVLEAVGGWDSYNVTEDADLSFRVSALRGTGLPYKIGCIGYGTQEEAIDTVQDWVQQRSRWLKGFMQTWAVHMRPKSRNPQGQMLHTKTRIKTAIALQITVGATLLATIFHVPSILTLTFLLGADALNFIDFTPSYALFPLVLFGYGVAILSAVVGAIRERKPRLILYSPLLPLYWLLHFPAMLIASYEFIFAPSFWHKTKHSGKDIQ
ncbi:MAG: hypothetical protein COA69_07270 [Robiginitomaculum sp.]|nr:MAG: hypothetical protein COA69_07270 [Robiginitomaculum sp.]